MGALAQTRQLIAAHTVSGCGMMHHYTWAHGKELPPCDRAVRDSRLDCAHTHHPALDEAMNALALDPQVPPEFIKCAREAIAVAHDALWIADLLAIELGDVGLSQIDQRGALMDDKQRVMSDAVADRRDGLIDGALYESAIKSAQRVGSSVMLALRNALLSVIDAIEEGAGSEKIARVVAAGRAHLERSAREAEKIVFPEKYCRMTKGAICSTSERGMV